MYALNIGALKYIKQILSHTHTHTLIPPLLYPPVDGHLVCFHILAVVNNTAINFGVHLSFQISVFLIGFPGGTVVKNVPANEGYQKIWV